MVFEGFWEKFNIQMNILKNQMFQFGGGVKLSGSPHCVLLIMGEEISLSIVLFPTFISKLI